MRLQQIIKTWRVSGSTILTEFFGGIITNGALTVSGLAQATRLQSAVVFPTYGAAVVIDCSLGSDFIIAVSNNTAFTVNAPTNPPTGVFNQMITVTIQNGAGGAHGAITWTAGAGGFRLAGALAAIANGQQRSIIFRWQPTTGLWQEIARTAADVANA